MAIFDPTSMIGTVIDSLTTNVTGSIFLSLLYMMLFFIGVASMFRLPIEITVPIVIPFLIVGVIITSQLIPALGVGLIYLAIIFTKRLFLN